MGPLNLNEMGALEDVSFDLIDVPEYATRVYPITLSDSAEFNIECTVDGDLFARLYGTDATIGKEFDVEYSTPILVQCRRHKKKRINKKWAKRYGYKTETMLMRIHNCRIKPNKEQSDGFIFYSKEW